MSTNSLPTVYEEDEAKQEDLDMDDPPAAEEAAAALAIADLQNSGTDHSAVAGGQATATPSPYFQRCDGGDGCIASQAGASASVARSVGYRSEK